MTARISTSFTFFLVLVKKPDFLLPELILQGLLQHGAHANLAMLHKKGDPHSTLKYRTISLLNFC